MEPSGRNGWQLLANGATQKALKQADPQPLATHGNRLGAHGKEGVDGSSPSEGFKKRPAERHFALPKSKTVGTRGHSRALADVPSPARRSRATQSPLNLRVRGKSDDRDIRKLLADPLPGLKTLSRVRGRHANVDDHEFGPKLAYQLDQLGGVPRLTHHLETGTLEQAGETLAHQDLVVRQHDPGRARAHRNDYGLP